MLKRLICFLAAVICCAHAMPSMADPYVSFSNVPQVIRPGKFYNIDIQVSQHDTATLQLLDADAQVVYAIVEDYPLLTGDNTIVWDGLHVGADVVTPGEYSLSVRTAGGETAIAAVRIGAPYPIISHVTQSTSILDSDSVLDISLSLSEAGTLDVSLMFANDATAFPLSSIAMSEGENQFQWRGMLNNQPLPDGQYALVMVLRADNGAESIPQRILVEIQSEPAPTATPSPSPTASATATAPAITAEPTSDVIASPTPFQPATLTSPAYSQYDDGTYWSMTPGELDDAIIWEILTQPITVYDGGLAAAAKTHAYLMENPDGTGRQIAQLHAQSQGLHVIGQPNEHGYVLVEAFSNYDDKYNPQTEEEAEHAFELKQGYVLAEHLKTVEVDQQIAFVIDKLTQRMYMFIDGERVTEFLISTGLISDGKLYNETPAGEYITISHTGGFWSGNMYCDMAIRINGGILLHEVPHKVNADGSRNYSSFEAYLGQKKSHGCVRIQRLKTPESYDHQWLWNNLQRQGGHKVIIWDDVNRYDAPVTWQANP